jgi:hypothetical protein
MKIEHDEIPTREGYITKIHLCCKCEGVEECEVKECKEKGWCHTFTKGGCHETI